MPAPSWDSWVAWLPESMRSDPESLRFVQRLLQTLHPPQDYLHRKIEALPELLNPTDVRDDLVRQLAGIVGLDSSVPAVDGTSNDDLRKLIGRAVALWKRKGTRASVRDVVASLTGSRSLILDWFHHRLVSGTPWEPHLLPAPGTSPGGWYDVPEQVSDVWFMDPDGLVDVDQLARWVDVVRGANERINLYRAELVDDLLAEASVWSGSGAGSSIYSPLGNVALYGGRPYLLLDGAWRFVASVGGAESSWTNYHLHLLLSVATVRAQIEVFSQDVDNCYRLVLVPGNPGSVTLQRVVGGTPTTLAVATLRFMFLAAYQWSVDVEVTAAGTEIAVRFEGQHLIWHQDATKAYTSGPPAVSTRTSGDGADLLSALLYLKPITPTRVGPGPHP